MTRSTASFWYGQSDMPVTGHRSNRLRSCGTGGRRAYVPRAPACRPSVRIRVAGGAVGSGPPAGMVGQLWFRRRDARRVALIAVSKYFTLGDPSATERRAVTTTLWRNREFNLLWSSQSLSDLGSAIAQLAVPLLVLDRTGSPVKAGVVGTTALVVKLAMRLPAGVLADRIDRRRVLLGCDVVRLIAFLLLAAAVAAGRANLVVIIVVTILDACCTAMFNTIEL